MSPSIVFFFAGAGHSGWRASVQGVSALEVPLRTALVRAPLHTAGG